MGAPSRDSTDASGRGSLLAGLTATTALVGWEAADGQGKRPLYLASLVARLMVCIAGTVLPCAVQLHVWFFLITLRWGESTSSAFKSQMPHALYRLCLTSHTLGPVFCLPNQWWTQPLSCACLVSPQMLLGDIDPPFTSMSSVTHVPVSNPNPTLTLKAVLDLPADS